MAPAVESWHRNARAAGDLSHALPVWWAHSLSDLLPHSGTVVSFHGRRLGPPGGWVKQSEHVANAGGGKRPLIHPGLFWGTPSLGGRPRFT